MKKQLKELCKKENLIPLLITLVLGVIIFFDTNYWNNTALGLSWIFILTIISVFILVIYLYAGVVVARALFTVAAGLSLIIFIAQSYCAVPRTESSDQALSSLIIVSLLYLTLSFSRTIYKEILKHYKQLDEGEKTPNGVLFVSSVFVISIVFFLAAIYKVMYPIVTNLCIYQ